LYQTNIQLTKWMNTLEYQKKDQWCKKFTREVQSLVVLLWPKQWKTTLRVSLKIPPAILTWFMK
jgi:hypothetical protein